VRGQACWYSLHIESCRVCKTGTSRLPYFGGSEPFRLGAACGRACVAHLEDSGMLTRKFASPFRARRKRRRESPMLTTNRCATTRSTWSRWTRLGVANIERFDARPPDMNPRNIMPKAKSVIVFLKRIVRGTCRGVDEGTHWSSYHIYSYAGLSAMLGTAKDGYCASSSSTAMTQRRCRLSARAASSGRRLLPPPRAPAA
jgi:hypothetical protein